jgi:O-antigen ligase
MGPKEFAPSEIFLVIDALIALAWLPRLEGGPRAAWQRIASSPFFAPAALFLVGATVSTVFAADRHHALQWFRLVILEPVVFFAILVALDFHARQWWLLLSSVVAAAAILAAIGLAQYITHQDLSIPPGSTVERVQAVYGSPDNLGLFFDRAIPLWLAVAVLARFPPRYRLAWIALAPLFAVILFLTYSRGAWVGVFAGCALVLALAYRWGRYLFAALVLVAAAGLALRGPVIADALRSGHSGTVQVRLDTWRSSVAMVRDHPVLGVGPDNFVHYFAPTRKEDRWQTQCAPGLGYMQPGAGAEPCLSHPHNVLLDFWLSTGILGLLSFLWLQLVFWRAVIRLQSFAARVRATPLLVGVMAAMAASLVHGLVDNSYFLEDLSIVFWLLCGYVSWLTREERFAAQERLAT